MGIGLHVSVVVVGRAVSAMGTIPEVRVVFSDGDFCAGFRMPAVASIAPARGRRPEAAKERTRGVID